MVKAITIITAALLLTGCESQYRYFCHNPENWGDERCKAPLCEINKDCPKHILPKQECAPDYLTKGDKK